MTITVLGAAESGYGSALLAKKEGFDVFVSDSGTIAAEYKEKLEEAAIRYEEGGHSMDKILRSELIIKSPGIPERAAVVQAALGEGIRVISEIEFAGKYTNSKTICITGSNGKTTTTTLIYEIMRRAGKSAEVVGNIGQSFAQAVATLDKQPDWYVIELSSFQLDGMFDFCADIALLLNITPDHLDRYDYRMQNYIDSKFRITRNQTKQEYFIYNADDQQTMMNFPVKKIEATTVPFSTKGFVLKGAYFDGELLHCDGKSLLAKDMIIKGEHNIANALAAIVATMKAGVDFEDIKHTLQTFTGVEHRLEKVAEIDGVEWINDSKATNVDSVFYALGAMTRPTIWIAGGTDKGNDYTVLKPLAKEHCKALICIGVDNTKLMAAFEGIVPAVYDTHSLEDTMRVAKEIAVEGDTVLLSPACASFDLFKNYEDRGRQFKNGVMSDASLSMVR
ncbi:UDP-N-acetylmuramoylalanine--D-glutamate ligase [Mucinivorans hirudinis]|uniref:UDP-N-acetylmuramoylalanine--D-glutamate ligase n=1 Tax=Mucinivorans hirudinis TaxID=1433126 RepID=A0A060RB75_9BACT|nr:UDP-N-acetylmuramoylalanine--D-glutamate ligase [Mucinivorans hirudinis]